MNLSLLKRLLNRRLIFLVLNSLKYDQSIYELLVIGQVGQKEEFCVKLSLKTNRNVFLKPKQ